MKMRLTLDSIKELDLGKVQAAYDVELKRCVRDCIDRPGDKTTRQVILKLDLVPDGDDGACDTVQGEFEIRSKVPPRRSKKYSLAVKAAGDVIVNPESPESIHQGTLDDQA